MFLRRFRSSEARSSLIAVVQTTGRPKILHHVYIGKIISIFHYWLHLSTFYILFRRIDSETLCTTLTLRTYHMSSHTHTVVNFFINFFFFFFQNHTFNLSKDGYVEMLCQIRGLIFIFETRVQGHGTIILIRMTLVVGPLLLLCNNIHLSSMGNSRMSNFTSPTEISVIPSWLSTLKRLRSLQSIFKS